jgi:HD-GYP domain-containing protein (c-di-GMP phosphodiesterase class II)
MTEVIDCRNGAFRVAALLRVIAEHDQATYLHGVRVAEVCREIGEVMELNDADLRDLHHGALLHDVGKIAIPRALLRKPDQLTAQEYSIVQRHVEYGYWMLKEAPGLERPAEIVLGSHEWFNGTGYPRRIAGGAIPLGSRIVAVADAFDAMTERHHHRCPRSAAEALEELERYAGTQFDPAIIPTLEIVLMLRELRTHGRSTDSASDEATGPLKSA